MITVAPTTVGNYWLRIPQQRYVLQASYRPNAEWTYGANYRLAVLAQGLVPVNAWLTTADGTRIGAVQQLTIRAAPPGAWLYIGMSVLFGLILIAGIVRAVRRPPRHRLLRAKVSF